MGALLALAVALTGCGGGATSKPDSKPPAVDSGPSADGVLPGGSADYVISKLTLPTGSTAFQLGVDFNNDGTVDNVLGSILAAFSTMAPAFEFQSDVNWVVNTGAAVHLMRVAPQNLTAWVTTAQCCQALQDPTLCASQAQASCFSGSHTFSPDPKYPQGRQLGGAITGSSIKFGPGTLMFRMPLDTGLTLDLDLKAAWIKGKLSGDTITDGVLAGAVSKADVDGEIVPAVANLCNDALTDPNTEPATKDTIKTLFDGNQDGSVTAQEVANSGVIKAFLGGDVDVDNDGVKELSMGLGFSAVKAVIATP
jgi:hypothetical protein